MMTQSLKNEGDTYHHFRLKKCLWIEELQCTLKVIEHIPSKAEIIHIENDDPENVFCLAFRTLPENSNGVAHILEHTVLCGSKKFPVKDPFFSMNRRSLNTYMNALTAPDFTCYPAASMVPQDFYNLLEVYLDAVFHPELKELSFLQEGHRLEFSEKFNPKSPLVYKGIVFNEMKGSLSSPISRLWQAIMASLFPHLLYRHNFGGEPSVIPTLTYEQLLEFHQKFYQESRCVYYFYGNFPTEKHLDFLETHTLKNAKPMPKLDANPIQKPLHKPVTLKMSYPASQEEELSQKTYFALSWLTAHLFEQKEVLALHVLDLILMGTDASPLKHKILQSKLCRNVFSNFEDELSQIPYSLIFEGTDEENIHALEKLTFKKLTKLSQKPLKEEWIEGALHQLEFSKSEISGDYGPFGLHLIFKLIPLKNIDADIENNLKIHSLFDALREDLKDPMYLSNLIKKYFLDNTHFSKIEMKPDPLLNKKEREEEEQKLKNLQSKLTEGQAQLLVDRAKKLADFQDKQEHQDLKVLPKITLKEVSKEPQALSLGYKEFDHSTLFYHTCFTNNVIYLDYTLPLPKLSEEELPYVRLFTSFLTQLGCANEGYKETLKRIQEKTGGVSCFIDVFFPIENLNAFKPRLVLQGKALNRNKEKLLELFEDFLASPNLTEVDRIKELITLTYSELDHDLKNNALKYATNLSYSGLSLQGRLSYYWYGLGYYEFVKDLVQHLDDKIDVVIEKFNELKDRLLHAKDAHIICGADELALNDLLKNEFGKLSDLPQKDYKPFEYDFKVPKVDSQACTLPSSVFFTALSLKTEGFENPDIPLLSIAAKLMDNTVLHKQIREIGGAYGGGASNRMGRGKFGFYAYRDPNLSKTLKAFHQGIASVCDGKFTDQELEEAKLGIIQKLDHPLLPEQKAYTGYTWHLENKTNDFRKQVRSKILNATKKEIQKVLEEKIKNQIDKAILITFSSKGNIEKENQKLSEKGFEPLKITSL